MGRCVLYNRVQQDLVIGGRQANEAGEVVGGGVGGRKG